MSCFLDLRFWVWRWKRPIHSGGGRAVHGPLALVPDCNSLSFLRREHRENEERIIRLPRHGLGFAQRQAKQLYICFKDVAEFGQDGLFHLLYPCHEVLAGRPAEVSNRRFGHGTFFGFNGIHAFLPFSSCLFSQIHAQKNSSTLGGHWFWSLYSQQFVCAPNSVAEDFQFVMNPRLGKQPLIVCEKRSCFGGRVGSVDHSGSVGIANGRFKILALLIEDFLDSLLQTVFLGADFRAQRKQRTAEDASALAPDLSLNTVRVIAISAEALERRNRWGEK